MVIVVVVEVMFARHLLTKTELTSNYKQEQQTIKAKTQSASRLEKLGKPADCM